MKLKRKRFLFTVLLMILLLLVVFLSSWFWKPKAPQNLEGLLKTIFTLPDEKAAAEGDARIQKILSPYCSEEKAESVFLHYITSKLPVAFLSFVEDEPFDQSMQVKKCVITPQKGKENSYDWAVVVTYGPKGTGTEMQFTGSARCDTEGKVEYWALSQPSQVAARQLYQALHS